MSDQLRRCCTVRAVCGIGPAYSPAVATMAEPAASRMDVNDSFVRAAVRRYRSATRPGVAGQAVLSRVLDGHVAEQGQRVLVNQSSEQLLCVAEQQGVRQNLLLRVQCGEARHELAADHYQCCQR